MMWTCRSMSVIKMIYWTNSYSVTLKWIYLLSYMTVESCRNDEQEIQAICYANVCQYTKTHYYNQPNISTL